jgi:hypothetical protein
VRPVRLSLAGLLGIVLAVAVGLAALSSPTDLWAATALSLTLAALGFAVVGALLRRGPARAYWVGLAVIGWGYLALSAVPEVRGRLLTTMLLDVIRARTPGMPRAGGRALVEQGGSYWPATVLAIRGGQFLVHYDGWAANFDEWVGPARLRTGPGPIPVGNGQPLGPTSVGISVASFPAVAPTTGGTSDLDNHQVIGHCLFALALGLSAAVAARRVFAVDEGPDGRR